MWLKNFVRGMLPDRIHRMVRSYRHEMERSKYRNLSTQQIFSKVYQTGAWGKSPDPSELFFSGNGSHDKEITSVYISAVQSLLGKLDDKPNVVDLGCGDFYVGSQVRGLCSNYIACDVVPELIRFNKERHGHLRVDFRVLDLVEDELPPGDIVFVRQVFQHLSNDQILKALPKIKAGYRMLVLSEHVPSEADFQPNLDIPAGPDIRVSINSGLDIVKPPFDFVAVNAELLCEVPEHGGVIRTIAFTLK